MATFTSKIAWTANDGNHRRGRSPDKEKDNFLRVQLFTMALNGIRKHETVSSRIYFYGCFLTMLIMDLAGVHFAYQNAGEILLVCDCLGPTFTCFLGVVKQYYLDVHREQLWYIIHELRKLKQNATVSDIEMIEKNNKIDQFLATAYFASSMGTGTIFIVEAILKGTYNYFIRNCIEWNLPIAISFPFDISHPAIFAFFFIWCSAATYMVVFSSVSSDAGFGGLASNLVVHFKILQNRFKDRRFEDDDQSLEDLIEYHTLVLKLSRRLMSSFRIIILNNLLVASVLLCVLGFEMVVYLGTSLMLLYITYITAIVIQIFFFSYYGSQLLYESAAVGDAIYCSNWYEATPKTRKLLLFCIKRAQVPVNTKVGIMVASLPTFRAIVNSAGSYVALLLSFTED
ncbi:odorant receptor 82a [Culex quinquefasciatus]|uniref:odorant receptor 82a n=1 Tax=Culex quinquefasciatus TaxID=7176 RepID=UPI0018E2CAEC|nr:odorant receptor 82a [Culex quinquefasciatus]